MANSEKSVNVRETEGPFLQAALFCEKVLQEKDNVVSAIRIVDRLISSAVGVDAPERMPPIQWNITMFIALKSGFAKGSFNVRVTGTTPSGRPMPSASLPVLLEGDDRGANIIGNMTINFQEEGLYWFDVYFEGRQLTRMPLRVVYQRMALGAQPQE